MEKKISVDFTKDELWTLSYILYARLEDIKTMYPNGIDGFELPATAQQAQITSELNIKIRSFL